MNAALAEDNKTMLSKFKSKLKQKSKSKRESDPREGFLLKSSNLQLFKQAEKLSRFAHDSQGSLTKEVSFLVVDPFNDRMKASSSNYRTYLINPRVSRNMYAC